MSFTSEDIKNPFQLKRSLSNPTKVSKGEIQKALVQCIEERQRISLSILLDHGADPDEVGAVTCIRLQTAEGDDLVDGVDGGREYFFYYSTPLQTCVMNDDCRSAELLLSKNADPNLRGKKLNDFQFKKSSSRELELISKPESYLYLNLPPLHLATRHGHKSMVQLLMKAGAHQSCLEETGEYPIHIAAREGHCHLIRLFCTLTPFLVDRRTEQGSQAGSVAGRTGLFIAGQRGHIDVVYILVDAFNADMSVQDQQDDNIYASLLVDLSTTFNERERENKLEMCSFYLKRNVDFKSVNANGFNCLDLAIKNGYTDVAELLEHHGLKRTSKSLVSGSGDAIPNKKIKVETEKENKKPAILNKIDKIPTETKVHEIPVRNKILGPSLDNEISSFSVMSKEGAERMYISFGSPKTTEKLLPSNLPVSPFEDTNNHKYSSMHQVKELSKTSKKTATSTSITKTTYWSSTMYEHELEHNEHYEHYDSDSFELDASFRSVSPQSFTSEGHLRVSSGVPKAYDRRHKKSARKDFFLHEPGQIDDVHDDDDRSCDSLPDKLSQLPSKADQRRIKWSNVVKEDQEHNPDPYVLDNNMAFSGFNKKVKSNALRVDGKLIAFTPKPYKSFGRINVNIDLLHENMNHFEDEDEDDDASRKEKCPLECGEEFSDLVRRDRSGRLKEEEEEEWRTSSRDSIRLDDIPHILKLPYDSEGVHNSSDKTSKCPKEDFSSEDKTNNNGTKHQNEKHEPSKTATSVIKTKSLPEIQKLNNDKLINENNDYIKKNKNNQKINKHIKTKAKEVCSDEKEEKAEKLKLLKKKKTERESIELLKTDFIIQPPEHNAHNDNVFHYTSLPSKNNKIKSRNENVIEYIDDIEDSDEEAEEIEKAYKEKQQSSDGDIRLNFKKSLDIEHFDTVKNEVQRKPQENNNKMTERGEKFKREEAAIEIEVVSDEDYFPEPPKNLPIPQPLPSDHSNKKKKKKTKVEMVRGEQGSIGDNKLADKIVTKVPPLPESETNEDDESSSRENKPSFAHTTPCVRKKKKERPRLDNNFTTEDSSQRDFLQDEKVSWTQKVITTMINSKFWRDGIEEEKFNKEVNHLEEQLDEAGGKKKLETSVDDEIEDLERDGDDNRKKEEDSGGRKDSVQEGNEDFNEDSVLNLTFDKNDKNLNNVDSVKKKKKRKKGKDVSEENKMDENEMERGFKRKNEKESLLKDGEDQNNKNAENDNSVLNRTFEKNDDDYLKGNENTDFKKHKKKRPSLKNKSKNDVPFIDSMNQKSKEEKGEIPSKYDDYDKNKDVDGDQKVVSGFNNDDTTKNKYKIKKQKSKNENNKVSEVDEENDLGGKELIAEKDPKNRKDNTVKEKKEKVKLETSIDDEIEDYDEGKNEELKNDEKLREEKLKEEKMREEKLREEKLREEKLRKEKLKEEKLREEKWREDKLKEEKLRKEKLKEEKLREEKLREEKLREETLREEKLREEKLKEEKLKEEKLKKEKLREEKLKEEKLREEKFREEKLKEEKLKEEKLREEKLREEKLREEKLKKEKLREEKLREEKLREEMLREEKFKKDKLREEKLREEKLKEEKLREEKLREEKLREKMLREEKLKKEKLREEKLKEEKLREEKLREEMLREEKLKKEKLREEKLKEEKLREEKLKEEKLREEKSEEKQVDERSDGNNLDVLIPVSPVKGGSRGSLKDNKKVNLADEEARKREEGEKENEEPTVSERLNEDGETEEKRVKKKKKRKSALLEDNEETVDENNEIKNGTHTDDKLFDNNDKITRKNSKSKNPKKRIEKETLIDDSENNNNDNKRFVLNKNEKEDKDMGKGKEKSVNKGKGSKRGESLNKSIETNVDDVIPLISHTENNEDERRKTSRVDEGEERILKKKEENDGENDELNIVVGMSDSERDASSELDTSNYVEYHVSMHPSDQDRITKRGRRKQDDNLYVNMEEFRKNEKIKLQLKDSTKNNEDGKRKPKKGKVVKEEGEDTTTTTVIAMNKDRKKKEKKQLTYSITDIDDENLGESLPAGSHGGDGGRKRGDDEEDDRIGKDDQHDDQENKERPKKESKSKDDRKENEYFQDTQENKKRERNKSKRDTNIGINDFEPNYENKNNNVEEDLNNNSLEKDKLNKAKKQRNGDGYIEETTVETVVISKEKDEKNKKKRSKNKDSEIAEANTNEEDQDNGKRGKKIKFRGHFARDEINKNDGEVSRNSSDESFEEEHTKGYVDKMIKEKGGYEEEEIVTLVKEEKDKKKNKKVSIVVDEEEDEEEEENGHDLDTQERYISEENDRRNKKKKKEKKNKKKTEYEEEEEETTTTTITTEEDNKNKKLKYKNSKKNQDDASNKEDESGKETYKRERRWEEEEEWADKERYKETDKYALKDSTADKGTDQRSSKDVMETDFDAEVPSDDKSSAKKDDDAFVTEVFSPAPNGPLKRYIPPLINNRNSMGKQQSSTDPRTSGSNREAFADRASHSFNEKDLERTEGQKGTVHVPKKYSHSQSYEDETTTTTTTKTVTMDRWKRRSRRRPKSVSFDKKQHRRAPRDKPLSMKMPDKSLQQAAFEMLQVNQAENWRRKYITQPLNYTRGVYHPDKPLYKRDGGVDGVFRLDESRVSQAFPPALDDQTRNRLRQDDSVENLSYNEEDYADNNEDDEYEDDESPERDNQYYDQNANPNDNSPQRYAKGFSPLLYNSLSRKVTYVKPLRRRKRYRTMAYYPTKGSSNDAKDLPPRFVEPGPVDFSKYGHLSKIWMEQVDRRTVQKSETMYLSVLPAISGEQFDPSANSFFKRYFEMQRDRIDGREGPEGGNDGSQWVIARGRSVRKAKRKWMEQRDRLQSADSSFLDGSPNRSRYNNQSFNNNPFAMLFFKIGQVNWPDLAWVLFDGIQSDSETVRMIKDIRLKHDDDVAAQIREVMARWWTKKADAATIEELQAALEFVNIPFIHEEDQNASMYHPGEDQSNDDQIDEEIYAVDSAGQPLDHTGRLYLGKVSQNDPDVTRLINEYENKSPNASYIALNNSTHNFSFSNRQKSPRAPLAGKQREEEVKEEERRKSLLKDSMMESQSSFRIFTSSLFKKSPSKNHSMEDEEDRRHNAGTSQNFEKESNL